MNKVLYFIFAFLIAFTTLNAQNRFSIHNIQPEYFVGQTIELPYSVYDQAYKYRVNLVENDTTILLTNNIDTIPSPIRGWLKYNFEDEHNDLSFIVEYFVDGQWKFHYQTGSFKTKIGEVFFVRPTNANYFYKFLTEISIENEYFKPDLFLLQNDNKTFLKTLNNGQLEDREGVNLKTEVFLSNYSPTVKLRIEYKNYAWESVDIQVSKDNIELVVDSLIRVINEQSGQITNLKSRLVEFENLVLNLTNLNDRLNDSLNYYKGFEIAFLECKQANIDRAIIIEELKDTIISKNTLIDSLYVVIESFKNDTLLIVVDDILASKFEEYVSLIKQLQLKVDDYYLTIDEILNVPHKIFIFDTAGKIKYINNGPHKPINVIDFPSGIYFVYVQGYGLFKFILV